MMKGYVPRLIRRAFILAPLALAVCLFSLPQDDDLLKISCSVQPKRLSRGEEGRVVLKLEIQKGVAISPQPSFIIEFVPVPEIGFPKNFFTASDLNLAVVEGEEEGCLDLSKPIEIPFTIVGDAKPGGHILEGRIKYFARSAEEGWCYKTTTRFSVAFTTRSAVFKKKQPPAD
jgi:hypothetical protein